MEKIRSELQTMLPKSGHRLSRGKSGDSQNSDATQVEKLTGVCLLSHSPYRILRVSDINSRRDEFT